MPDINLLADLEKMIANKLFVLTKRNYTPAPGEDINTIVERYVNLKRRVLPVIKWNVAQSKELLSKSLPSKIKLGLQNFIDKANSGKSLKEHLSKKISNPNYKDLMFYDWEVFHFHLGTNPDLKNKGFVERTDDLLFAIADSDTAKMYLIDIRKHQGGFIDQNFLRIIEENWPEILDEYTLSRVQSLPYNVSNDDINTLLDILPPLIRST